MDEHLFQQPKEIEKESVLSLPTETIIKLGAEKFISPSHPTLLPHSEQDCVGIQLIQNLLYCANKVAENQHEIALKFLKACDAVSSSTGTPIQRLVFYFSEALHQKIARETARIIPKQTPLDLLELVMTPNMHMQAAFYKDYPLSRILKLVGVQAVFDHLKGAKKVHIIDLVIRSGMHWLILMQALASRNELLKISVVAHTKWEAKTKEVGKQLASYAHSLHLNFSFKIVLVEDFLDLDPTCFERVADESVSIYVSHALMSMVGRVDRLKHLMTVMRSLRPGVMIVTESEFNSNSPNFIGRFVESLFYFGAIFDSLSDCFKNDESSRVKAESTWLRPCVKNILTSEGEERKMRHVNTNMWRAFFAHHGLVESELSLSVSPLDQASVGLESLACGRSCTLYMDGKCLIMGWKGTPLCSLSAWKFQ